jgi:RNA polymerase sigma factor (sigma-70 family)
MKPIRSDEQLIDQFLTAQKEDSESAFETLLKRHGPMVLGVCRHVLRRDQDAEDAFQATFLVLARKAGTIHNREILGCWLHEVAYRTAIRARERRARSTPRMEIQEVAESHSGPENAASRNELRLLLRAEVDGLPAKYRSLVLHTYMEGKSNEQVARLLRCPVGTVKGRLSRARDLLRARLSRRGWDQDEVRYRWGWG